MKSSAKLLTTLFIMLLLFSCKKYDNSIGIKENCQVQKLVTTGTDAAIRTYTYDAEGRVSSTKMALAFNFGGNEIEFHYIYYYIRANDGSLTSMKVAYEDNQGYSSLDPIDIVKDSKGRVIKLIEYSNGSIFATHELKYNLQGLVSEYKRNDANNPEFSFVRYFKYNFWGQMVQIVKNKLDGVLVYEKIFENMNKTRSNEAYLVQKGMLPLDMLYGEAFAAFDGGQGTVLKAYGNDADGNKIQYAEVVTKSVLLNSKGYPKSRHFEYTDGKFTDELYDFNCNVFDLH